MAKSGDRLLIRASQDVSLDGEIWGAEVHASDGSVKIYGIAGADGQAEAERVANELSRQASESDRMANETLRESAEAERAAKDAERDAATKAANASALAASSAAQAAEANSALAHEQAIAASDAAAQASAAARLTKPYFIQSSEPQYPDRVDGGMWVETSGTAVASVNRWDAGNRGSALYPSAATYPQSTTFPAPRGAWAKFTV